MAKTKSKQEEQVDFVGPAPLTDEDLAHLEVEMGRDADAVISALEQDLVVPPPPPPPPPVPTAAPPPEVALQNLLEDAAALLYSARGALADLLGFVEERQLVARNDRQRAIVENARRVLKQFDLPPLAKDEG